jgi:hypothetical protein
MKMMTFNYQNGPWSVTLDKSTGTKIREQLDGTPQTVMQPETFDLKVTDFCNAGCKWCHEESTVRGQHAELEPLKEALHVLRPGFEVAIGGGDPTSWPHLQKFLEYVALRGGVSNITVNSVHINRVAPRLAQLQSDGLLFGIGISSSYRSGYGIECFGSRDYDYHRGEKIRFIEEPFGLKHVVGHIILGGLYQTENIFRASERGYLKKYLLLGAKNFGRGTAGIPRSDGCISIPAEVNILMRWAKHLGIGISFDNLALKQGDVQSQVAPHIWEKYYMGDDGKFSMYVDAVRQEWAVTSTQSRSDRVSWKKMGMVDYFNNQL